MANAMERNRPVLATLAGSLGAIGSSVLIYKALGRADVAWWTDPIFWIGTGGLVMSAFIFLVLLLPPWLADRRARRARKAELLRQGRANKFDGLDEILRELGQISNQLKNELRWGQRGDLFPNTAWTKNQQLITGEAKTLVNDAYEQLHWLDQQTIAATQPGLDKQETQERQRTKGAVDAASAVVRKLRDEVQP
jgi:hypothetical protein